MQADIGVVARHQKRKYLTDMWIQGSDAEGKSGMERVLALLIPGVSHG